MLKKGSLCLAQNHSVLLAALGTVVDFVCLMARCQKLRRSPDGNDSADGGSYLYGLV